MVGANVVGGADAAPVGGAVCAYTVGTVQRLGSTSRVAAPAIVIFRTCRRSAERSNSVSPLISSFDMTPIPQISAPNGAETSNLPNVLSWPPKFGQPATLKAARAAGPPIARLQFTELWKGRRTKQKSVHIDRLGGFRSRHFISNALFLFGDIEGHWRKQLAQNRQHN